MAESTTRLIQKLLQRLSDPKEYRENRQAFARLESTIAMNDMETNNQTMQQVLHG